jgi:hypothetical protein
MGTDASTVAVTALSQHFAPQCLAMCGVCAGRPEWAALGDVIADRVYRYDVGETFNATRGGDPVFRGDLFTHPFRALWKLRADSVRVPNDACWLAERPIPHSFQQDWLLAELWSGRNPVQSPDRQGRCPDWSKVAKRLRQEGLIELDGSARPSLTETGRKRAAAMAFVGAP